MSATTAAQFARPDATLAASRPALLDVVNRLEAEGSVRPRGTPRQLSHTPRLHHSPRTRLSTLRRCGRAACYTWSAVRPWEPDKGHRQAAFQLSRCQERSLARGPTSHHSENSGSSHSNDPNQGRSEFDMSMRIPVMAPHLPSWEAISRSGVGKQLAAFQFSGPSFASSNADSPKVSERQVRLPRIRFPAAGGLGFVKRQLICGVTPAVQVPRR